MQAVFQSAGSAIHRQFLASRGQQNIALCILQSFRTICIVFKILDICNNAICFCNPVDFPFQTQVNGKMCIFFQRFQCIHSSPQILRNDPGIRVGGVHYNLIAFVMQKLLHLLPVHSAAVKVYNGLPGCLHRFCAFRLFPHYDFTVFRCHAYRMCDSGIRQNLRQSPSFCGSRKYYKLFHSAFSPFSAW